MTESSCKLQKIDPGVIEGIRLFKGADLFSS